MMIKGLHHNAYRCRDSEETRAFYEDFLGLPLVNAFEINTTKTGRAAKVLHSFYAMADGSCLAFFEAPDLVGKPVERDDRGDRREETDGRRNERFGNARRHLRECRLLRESLREIELVRLTDGAWQQPPIAAALTLDGTMSPSVLASTICAVLRLVERTSTV